MSKNAVKPPAASAAVPVSRPSQCVRPGSLKCTCGSRPPGKTCRPVASSSWPPPSRLGRDAPRSRRRARRRRPPAARTA